MPRREISPAVNLSAGQYFARVPEPLRGVISSIRAAKEDGSRPRPSASLIDRSGLFTPARRAALLDKVAELVDENLGGRSDMCLQFAELLNLALRYLGLNSFAVSGTAVYLNAKGKRVFTWDHAWVRVGKEVIDGNTDSLTENVMVPSTVCASPYWGPMDEAPGRKLEQAGYVNPDGDVNSTWWPDLKDWLAKDFQSIE